jgi:hypothetical protein
MLFRPRSAAPSSAAPVHRQRFGIDRLATAASSRPSRNSQQGRSAPPRFLGAHLRDPFAGWRSGMQASGASGLALCRGTRRLAASAEAVACAQTSTGRSRCPTAGGCSQRRPRLARCRSVVAARGLACASGVTRGRRGSRVRDRARTARLAGPVAAAARVPDSRARRGGHRARSAARRYTHRREQRA